MRRSIGIAVLAVAIVATAVAVAWGGTTAGNSQSRARPAGGARVITVIEHATTDATTDTGAQGDSAGDMLTFANEVFDAKDAKKVGTDQGYCIRTVAGKSYECNWTTFLPGGQITVEGPFFDARNSTLAVTGGTGRYRRARGTVALQSRANGGKFAFVFRLVS